MIRGHATSLTILIGNALTLRTTANYICPRHLEAFNAEQAHTYGG